MKHENKIDILLKMKYHIARGKTICQSYEKVERVHKNYPEPYLIEEIRLFALTNLHYTLKNFAEFHPYWFDQTDKESRLNVINKFIKHLKSFN